MVASGYPPGTTVRRLPERLQPNTASFQASDTDKVTSERGWGLGLSICDGLARIHGGHLAVESEVGRGARVFVCLPDGA